MGFNKEDFKNKGKDGMVWVAGKADTGLQYGADKYDENRDALEEGTKKCCDGAAFCCEMECCFPGDATVISLRGTTKMTEVKVGDVLMAGSQDGSIKFSEVYAWGHHDAQQPAVYYKITAGNRTLCVTGNHLVPVVHSAKPGSFKFIPAKDVTTNDTMYTIDESNIIKEGRVMLISKEHKLGLFAPFTKCGTVLVDGILASCYSEVGSQKAAHLGLSWLRAAHNMGMLVQTEGGQMCHSGADMHGAHIAVKMLASVAPHYALRSPSKGRKPNSEKRKRALTTSIRDLKFVHHAFKFLPKL